MAKFVPELPEPEMLLYSDKSEMQGKTNDSKWPVQKLLTGQIRVLCIIHIKKKWIMIFTHCACFAKKQPIFNSMHYGKHLLECPEFFDDLSNSFMNHVHLPAFGSVCHSHVPV